MRRRMILRRSRVMRATVGAMILGVPASAAFADAPRGAQAETATGPTLTSHIEAHRIGFGRSVTVTGQAPAANAGQAVSLEFEPAGVSTWRQLTTSQIGSGGSFRLSAPLHGSGQVKVTTLSPSDASVAFAATAVGASSTAPERVLVAAALRVGRHNRAVLGSGTLAIRGQLLPRSGGRHVVLQVRRGRRWVTLARTRTGSNGRFRFRYHADAPGQEALRVRFRGDRSNTAVSASMGRVAVLRQSLASWYDDAGTTACGFHAYYGVANLSLPCGTRVSFSNGGRRVTATVDDRGPYVGGREWDLNQNTAAALGFGGVGAVWSSS